jgi:hypothetical protein
MIWKRDDTLHRAFEEGLHRRLPQKVKNVISFKDSGYFDHERYFGLLVTIHGTDVVDQTHLAGRPLTELELSEAVERLAQRIFALFGDSEAAA